MMRCHSNCIDIRGIVAVVLGAIALLTTAASAVECADDAVPVGDFCIDKYEASVWTTPPGGPPGTQLSTYPCAANGQDCGGKIFARSITNTNPAIGISWFQALAACANVGKRLPTNAEWQMAVASTRDAGAADDQTSDCNTNTPFPPVPTGSRSQCVSFFGAYDMVGNVGEWVADWVPRSTFSCTGWGAFSDDAMCLTGAAEQATGPGALFRGGDFASGAAAGAFFVSGQLEPYQQENVGFRCAR
jgi:formylglycine-generating enzyme required for sulfatase activity